MAIVESLQSGVLNQLQKPDMILYASLCIPLHQYMSHEVLIKTRPTFFTLWKNMCLCVTHTDSHQGTWGNPCTKPCERFKTMRRTGEVFRRLRVEHSSLAYESCAHWSRGPRGLWCRSSSSKNTHTQCRCWCTAWFLSIPSKLLCYKVQRNLKPGNGCKQPYTESKLPHPHTPSIQNMQKTMRVIWD